MTMAESDKISDKLIGEMDDKEFKQMVEAFIDRPAGPDDEIPAELVFAMLDRAEQSEHAMELESAIVDDRLVLSTNIREIEVNLPGVRVIVNLESATA
ncbi:MAG: hypothetical protein MAG451_02689 [Anaerolineales bacterium]|nr:hypothetical protein [Anaerolineales bacterium]